MSNPTWTGVDPLLLRRLGDRQARLNRLQPWPARAAERLWEGILPAWIAGTNALDGNRLSLEDTAHLLHEGGSLPQFTLREHLEALNHRQAISYVRRMARGKGDVSAANIRRLHAMLMADIDDESAGRYRSHRLESEGEAESVADLVRRWELWLSGPAQSLSPLEKATVAHHRLLRLQPFRDGNGAAARLVLNLLLMRDSYLPAVIHGESRHDYREALYKADAGDYAPLTTLVALAVERVQTIFLLALEP